MIQIPIVQVGNSRGIRIPKKILDAMGSPEQVSLELDQKGILVVRPLVHARAAWNDVTLWRNARLTNEDHEWLDAELTDEDNVE